MDLTAKQRKFVTFYIETGSASQAMKQAGYSVKYAAQNADRVLKHPKIKAALEARMKELEDAKVAKTKEILEFLTSVLRGEVTEEVVVVEGVGEGCSSARIIEKKVGVKDRLKAAELLAKRYGLLTEKVSLGSDDDNEIKITVVKASAA